jgi:predicted porin
MQKKLLTIAVAAALVAPVAAMADVTVYGQMHFSYDWVDGAPAAGTTNKDVSEDATGVSRESRIGFKGSEDLGGGLKGIWQIEAKVDNAADKVAWRNTFAGLSGGFGTVLAGRHDTPYKLSTGKIDPFTDRVGDYNMLIGSFNGSVMSDERAPQTIAYVSPNFSGFSGAIAYVSHYFNQPTAGAGAVTWEGDDNDRAVSAMVMYDNAGFFASAAYEWVEGNNVLGALGAPASALGSSKEPTSTAIKVGLGYTFSGFTVGGVYENIDLDSNKSGESSVDRDAFYFTGSYAFGPSAIKGFYGWADDVEDTKNTGADMWGVGYDYNLSKRTTLYALYTGINNEGAGRYGANSGQGLGSAYQSVGHNLNVYSVGVIHKF